MKPDVEMTFGEHLEELRRRIIYALLGLLVTTGLCGVFYEELLVALIRPYKQAYDWLKPAEPEPAKPAEKPAAEPSAPPADPLAAAVARIEARLDTIEARIRELEQHGSSKKADAPYDFKFPPPRIIQGGPLTGYLTVILLCIICGIILASPWVLYQIWAFVGVGLYPHERRVVYTYGPFSFCLFVGGAAMFYFLLLPLGLRALMSPTAYVAVDGVPMIDPSFFLDDYFKFVAMMTLIFGVIFQTPLVVMFLARARIVPLKTLARQQRIVILVMSIVAAFLTPTVDPVGMAAMAVPLILLYELGLLLAWISERKRRKQGDQGSDYFWNDSELPEEYQ